MLRTDTNKSRIAKYETVPAMAATTDDFQMLREYRALNLSATAAPTPHENGSIRKRMAMRGKYASNIPLNSRTSRSSKRQQSPAGCALDHLKALHLQRMTGMRAASAASRPFGEWQECAVSDRLLSHHFFGSRSLRECRAVNSGSTKRHTGKNSLPSIGDMTSSAPNILSSPSV